MVRIESQRLQNQKSQLPLAMLILHLSEANNSLKYHQCKDHLDNPLKATVFSPLCCDESSCGFHSEVGSEPHVPKFAFSPCRLVFCGWFVAFGFVFFPFLLLCHELLC